MSRRMTQEEKEDFERRKSAFKLKQKRKAKGICTCCGEAAAVKGHTLCPKCLEHVNKLREWMQAKHKEEAAKRRKEEAK